MLWWPCVRNQMQSVCNAADIQEGMNCANEDKPVWRSTFFNLLGFHQGQEVPSLQSHQETPEHTNKQGDHVIRGGTKWQYCVHTVKMVIWTLDVLRYHISTKWLLTEVCRVKPSKSIKYTPSSVIPGRATGNSTAECFQVTSVCVCTLARE